MNQLKPWKLVLAMLVIISAYFLSQFIHFLFSFDSFGGCYPREDITATTTINPATPCLKISAGSSCTSEISLDIENTCDEVYLYEKDDQTLELYNHDQWIQVQETNPLARNLVYDNSVPQDFGTWTKELRYKDDPSKIVTVTVNATENTTNQQKIELQEYLPMTINGLLIVGVIFFLYFLFKND